MKRDVFFVQPLSVREITMLINIDKFKIRDWEKNDTHSIAKYANNRKIWQNLRDGFPYPYNLSDAENFLSLVLAQNPRTYYALASQEEAIGSIGLGLGADVHRFSAEMGYWLAEPFWNKGIMTKAVALFTEFAFDKFNLNRIYAEPYVTNPASARVLEKAGFFLGRILKKSLMITIPQNFILECMCFCCGEAWCRH
ncbi:MAG: GNAT family N-acetyltransferase [Candidatus Aminicenantes bacterium]|nr:GNAT family N-acetyltransferase [Candidatus Aminicenantes bacterium]